MNSRGYSTVVLLTMLFIIVFATAYLYLLKTHPPEVQVVPVQVGETGSVDNEDSSETITIKLFFPERPKLVMEQREIPRVFSQKKILKIVISEFLKGPAVSETFIAPGDTAVLDLYIGSDAVAYINLSEDFRRNFHGDTIDEFLLLRGIYESAIANIKINDIRILIEGKELDSIGGHFLADRPLKRLVTQEIKLD